MIDSLIERGSKLMRIRGAICQALRADASYEELKALLKAEEYAVEEMKAEMLAHQEGWTYVGTTEGHAEVTYR